MGSYALCLTANLVQLVSLAPSLTSSLGQYVTAKQSPLSHWHPVLGWFSVSLDKHLQSSMSLVKSQLSRLWSPDCLLVLTADLQSQAASLPAIPAPPTPSPEETNFGKKLMKQALEKTRTTYAATTSTISSPLNRLGGPASTKVALVCALYQTACRTLAQLRIDIPM